MLFLVLITVIFGSILCDDKDRLGFLFVVLMMLAIISVGTSLINIRRIEAYNLLTTGRTSLEAYYLDHKDGTRTVEYRSWQQPVETPSPILGPKQ
jgi:hypothetical protein